MKTIKDYKKMLRIYQIMFVAFSLSFLGITFNFNAIVENGGRMPVLSAFHFETDSHFTYEVKDSINYWYLTDIIQFGDYIYSVGDVLIYLAFAMSLLTGAIWVHHLYSLSRKSRKHKGGVK